MKHSLLAATILLASSNLSAATIVNDETSFKQAMTQANENITINEIVFAKNARINLSAPIIYTGKQDLSLRGNGVLIDGQKAGGFSIAKDLTATTKDGSLVFNSSGNISIEQLTLLNSASRGIVINIPSDAIGDDIQVSLDKVRVFHSALYGLHIDDNADEFDTGMLGSNIGIKLTISSSSFVANGVGAIDFDGIRVDERSKGSITAVITDTHIDANGADGIELDEAGEGDVNATFKNVTLNSNGFYNMRDLDDGFDIDEAGEGDVNVTISHVQANNNMDAGLDFDESDAGSINASISKTKVNGSYDDGIQLSELGTGHIEVTLKKVSVANSTNYGVKIEQWLVKGEDQIAEKPGALKTKKLKLKNNGKDNQMKLHNMNLN
ncbi:MAG: hypothetical protein GQ582_06905 [Methyloprofundus sp.]|nr:hypothetical protein [Methyloprofundus sp.]